MDKIIVIILFTLLITSFNPIQQTELKIRNLSIEMAYVFHGDYEIFHVKGDGNSFWIPDILILNGSILLHNHPSHELNGFSYKDIKLAIAGNVSKMLLVTQTGLWETTKPFKSWNYMEWK